MILIVTVAALAWSRMDFRAARGADDALAQYGIRLGMSPADVRATFSLGHAEGSQWRVVADAEPALEWRSGARSMRFEFHGAQLMAVRAMLLLRDPSTQGRQIEVSTATVVRRHPQSDGRVEVTLLARECPTHAAEAQRIITNP
ncbi:MAG: hypothetical protein Q8Q09_15885 [Deltaproteobacteria bacterium]|nr:hypothetical protein [Deltaproteobacteria bacterium]